MVETWGTLQVDDVKPEAKLLKKSKIVKKAHKKPKNTPIIYLQQATPLLHLQNKASLQTNPSKPPKHASKLNLIKHSKIVIFVSLKIWLKNEGV